MGMRLLKLNIYQGTVVIPNYFKNHTNSWGPDFYQKNVLSDVRSEIHLARRNIASTGQSVQALKKLFRPVM